MVLFCIFMVINVVLFPIEKGIIAFYQSKNIVNPTIQIDDYKLICIMFLIEYVLYFVTTLIIKHKDNIKEYLKNKKIEKKGDRTDNDKQN